MTLREALTDLRTSILRRRAWEPWRAIKLFSGTATRAEPAGEILWLQDTPFDEERWKRGRFTFHDLIADDWELAAEQDPYPGRTT